MITKPYELFIGLRYLRAKRRQRTISMNTFISIGGVTLGVAALIATLAVMTGFKENLRDKILGTNAHVIITDRTRDTIKDYSKMVAEVQHLPHVVAATPFIYNQVLISTEAGVYGVILRGIDPQLEPRVTDIKKNLIDGNLAALEKKIPPKGGKEEPSLPGIIIGKELAGRFGLRVGDKLSVMSPVGTMGPLGFIPKIRRFQVVGVFDTGMYEYDSTLAYVSLAVAQDFFNLGDVTTGVEVKVDDIFIADQVANEIEQKLGFPFGARDWMKLNRNLFSALKLEKIMMFIILVLIILVASFNIVSTLTMIVVEKNREIAILKAMGATRQRVMRIFMVDGLIIGVVGILIGVPLGYLASWAIQTFYTFPSDVYYISHIPAKIRLMDVVLVSLSAVTISFLATLYPSWQAAKLNPSEALRYE